MGLGKEKYNVAELAKREIFRGGMFLGSQIHPNGRCRGPICQMQARTNSFNVVWMSPGPSVVETTISEVTTGILVAVFDSLAPATFDVSGGKGCWV